MLFASGRKDPMAISAGPGQNSQEIKSTENWRNVPGTAMESQGVSLIERKQVGDLSDMLYPSIEVFN